jgi:hypothetical protein
MPAKVFNELLYKKYINMKNPAPPKLRLLFALAAFLFVLPHAVAQVKYPVTAGGFRVKPGIYLDDYVSPGTMNMSATFVLNDFHETVGCEVFLRFGIESAAYAKRQIFCHSEHHAMSNNKKLI